MTTHSIKIDPEFKAFIPPLKPEEYAQLEQNILSDGCRDPLVVWMLPEFVTEEGDVFKLSEYSILEHQNGDENWEKVRCWEGAEQDYFQEDWPCLLIDGHNRFEICNRHDIDFNVVEMEFDSRDDVLEWIDDNQLGKRNLTPDQTALLLGRKYNRAKKAQGGRADRDFSGAQNDLPKTADKIAAQHGVSPATVKRAGQFADAVERIEAASPGFTESVLVGNSLARQDVVEAASYIDELPKEIVAKGVKEILSAAKQIRAEMAETRRAERIEKLVEISRGNAPLDQVAEKFPVIYADPPWRYEHAVSESREIENQYPTMSLDEIKALSLGDVATDDCVLFMWATSPKLAESIEVLDAWGFTYRTCAVWDKQKIGMGYYFRQQHELLLVATKGSPPTPSPQNRPSSVMSFPRGDHSAKPVEVYEIIEAMYEELPKLELFCRSPRSGWGVWGNQAVSA